MHIIILVFRSSERRFKRVEWKKKTNITFEFFLTRCIFMRDLDMNIKGKLKQTKLLNRISDKQNRKKEEASKK